MTDNEQSRRSETDRERAATAERSLAAGASSAVSRRNLLLAAATASAVGVPRRVGGSRGGAASVGAVVIDGSEAHRRPSAVVAREVRRKYPDAELSVRGSGTADGFRRFATGEVDAHVAGRPMHPSERERVAANDVAFERVELALGGAALVHSRREWYDCVRQAQLVETWVDDAEVETYAELADAEAASGKSALSIDSTAASRRSRNRIRPSDDARVVVRGTREFQYERGFGGLGHYEPNAADVRPLAAVGGEEDYTPLVRLAFLYLNRESSRRTPVEAFERAYRNLAARTTGGVEYYADPTEAR